MDITPLVPEGRQIIESYGSGRFRIAGQIHLGSVLVFPERTEAWSVVAPEHVTADALAAIVAAGKAGDVELLLLGCGPRLTQVTPALRAALREVGIGIEPMDTGAACRTFNVLMAEGRRVAAALIAVESARATGAS
ncbi:MAG: Mth938-like domain-containing protein [Rhodospirillaceae bacterium]|nr:Mth938-like domain-containing protein [Rhodospirillaceae bacterium]